VTADAAPGPAGPIRLADRRPEVADARLLAGLAPPPRFAAVRFDSYRPDPAQPTQAGAVESLRRFAGDVADQAGTARRWWPAGRRRGERGPAGVYLDGGFGVGKTHLLASLWHATPGERAYGTFVEYTHLVGALGFRRAVEVLSRFRLLCVDEFELDDPGDTVLMSRLLRELVDAGVRLAATSNTLPDALGEGRFAAADFRREIQALAGRFRVVRVDGEDYRHRGVPVAPRALEPSTVVAAAQARPGASLDDFGELVRQLARVHPSRYGALLDGVSAVCVTGLRPLPSQDVALRLVVLVDRLYDRDLPLLVAGCPVDRLFTAEMLAGGYRKKYRRATSRLVALARQGAGT
jgi:cell division protein ZapE